MAYKEMNFEILAHINNNGAIKTSVDGVDIEGSFNDIIAFCKKYNIGNFDTDIRKAAAEVYNLTEGSEPFETHKKSDEPRFEGNAFYAAAYARREEQRKAARDELAALRRSVTRINRKPAIGKVVDVKYVPEYTFIPQEAKKTKTSRLLVEIETAAGRYIVNIADAFHQAVGRCSKERTAKLIANAADVVLEKGNITADSLQMWFVLSGFNLKTSLV